MGFESPEEEADSIFEMADRNFNGTLEFTEWVAATMDKTQVLSRKRLKAVFNMFDLNSNGSISY